MGRLLGLVLLWWSGVALAESASVELFSPQGEVKGVRQVTARFSMPVVPFGAPTQTEPFDIECPFSGTSRWIDDRNWVFDFDRDLPAGVRCVLKVKPDLKDSAGGTIGAGVFSFDTGGPAIVESMPYEGDERIDEEQVFVFGLDAAANEATVERNAYCDISGRGERVPVRIIKSADKKTILDRRQDFLNRYRQRIAPGSDEEKALRAREYDKLPIVLLACRSRLPNEAEMRVVWGRGIAALSGVETRRDQVVAFKVREPFLAKFSCDRTRPSAPCIPVLPMRVEFTAPVALSVAERVELLGDDNKKFSPTISDHERKSGYVRGVVFNGPFPDKAALKLTVPEGIVDDAGRTLGNAKRYPLSVRTAIAPPLAKFPAVFGILESKAAPALPLTVRNVEAVLRGKRVTLPASASDTKPLSGRTLKVQSPVDIVAWLRRLEQGQARYTEGGYVSSSVLDGVAGAQNMSVPRASKGRGMEVIGIPLPKPGFYVVEVVSPKLGASLLKDAHPYYISTGALVTNLAVHFKWGRESSLIWVTSLDRGEPVARAEVQIMDCKGETFFKGVTDKNGIARIKSALPERETLPPCKEKWNRELFVTAKLGDDVSFVFSDWGEGIAPWRFNLRTADEYGSKSVATVFDRTLLRAGETVSMKHFVRLHGVSGFKFVAARELPARAVIRHQGSGDVWEFPLKWDAAAGVAESTWSVPKDAKTGSYELFLAKPKKTGEEATFIDGPRSGSFRVEAFRVPMMKAQLSAPSVAQIAVTEVSVGVQLNYFSGGGAANQRVRVRPLLQPKSVTFPGFEGVAFANGNIVEGREARDVDRWFDTPENEADTLDVLEAPGAMVKPLTAQSLQLDGAGGGSVRIEGLPKSDRPQELLTEVEFSDPNGEINTRSARVALWPSRVVLGVQPDGWALAKDKVKLQVFAVDTAGKVLEGIEVAVDVYERDAYSHRKRLIGGFYAYEYGSQINRIGDFCSGRTDNAGRMQCEAPIAKSGNLILRARAKDENGNDSHAHADVWVAGGTEWWFDVSNDDRMDLIAERKRYQPGDTAKLQVRAPFRSAKALVTVEREGVIDGFVTALSGQEPVVEVPIKGAHAPNVFVSVLAVRGRITGAAPTALVDLGKPAFRMGVAEVNVGWRDHELAVRVSAEREVYKTREKARVRVEVKSPDGTPARGGEVAVAAVDEGLLDLLPNGSWDLLASMLQPRAIEVTTVTGVTQVVGKRHFGKKAVPTGGGGGRQTTRELFDTQLLWRGRVKLDDNGMAEVDVPLNDSLTAFRIVAVASAGAALFGTGSTTIRTSQDVIVTSGLPPLVRDADKFAATFTVRNGSNAALDITVTANAEATSAATKKPLERLDGKSLALAPGEAKDVAWSIAVPAGADSIRWQINASAIVDGSTLRDTLAITQRVVPVVPVRVVQATMQQLDRAAQIPVALPADAIPGRGELSVMLRAKLSEERAGLREFMVLYPYTCLEQRFSQAITLDDDKRWADIVTGLPAYLDNDGFAKYFVSEAQGNDVLTSYLINVSHAARREIPDASRTRMLNALNEFAQGRLSRGSAMPTSDLTMRRVAALEALSRFEPALDAGLASTLRIEPNLWPTSTVIDWMSLLSRWSALPERAQYQREAEQVLRSRMTLQGTVMNFSADSRDALWWLMVSADVNAARALLALMELPQWREDIPRLMRGAIARQQRGAWSTTVANAWGAIALDQFGHRFERDTVAGVTSAALSTQEKSLVWREPMKDATLRFAWPAQLDTLKLTHDGLGKPWVTIQSRAAVNLTAALQSGYRLSKQVAVVAPNLQVRSVDNAVFQRGDLVRVTLDVDARSDMTWVVVSDPIPSGASILGSGLGNGGKTNRERTRVNGLGDLLPVFEERTFEAYRAYYRYVPKGRWTLQYAMRLNNPGTFELPPTRVEAMYAPESFGELPNIKVSVLP